MLKIKDKDIEHDFYQFMLEILIIKLPCLSIEVNCRKATDKRNLKNLIEGDYCL